MLCSNEELENFFNMIKERIGYKESVNQYSNRIITSVQLEHHENGHYFVCVYFDNSDRHRIMGFPNSQVIQAIGEFLQCEKFIGKTDEEFIQYKHGLKNYKI